MTNIELISFVASIASLLLAIVAIVLSILFYIMSFNLSVKSTEAAKVISASVDKLEGLFNTLYTDTFTMMRDTVSDMRKHIWPEQSTTDEGITPEIEKRADEKILALKNEMAEEVSKMLHKQRMTDDKLSTITREMEVLLDKAIVGSRKVDIEAREETIRDVLLDIIKQQSSGNSGSIAASDIVEQLRAKFPFQRIIDELLKMEREGIIMLSDHIIQPPTRIKLSDKKRPIARFKGKS